ncbi:hypothetical protein THAOC_15418 [Thalassiosira oceanica]|uniref:Uncharacterized protein n=1 Tax=Thalassiosira oceanica TaxID=159749 RepID=K0SEW2_THAOC|nr:hypothetical protein THAOC_15418 [Thalassiosira oceanica]|eukprot:EJK63900.1 hypothetical protein THAOC_15418 [Thalassiosira oceanica]
MPRDNERARLLPSAALDILGNDLLVRCASYLDADGLAQLGRTSARFGIPQAGQERSLANEAARQRFRQSATEEERSRLPEYDDESDVGLLRALEQLRQPLRFDELAGTGSALKNILRVLHTQAVLYGRQQCQGIPVSLTDGIDLQADWEGEVHPVCVSSDWKPAVAEKLRSQRTARWGEDSNVHCCAYHCYDGQCYLTDWNTEDEISDDCSDWQGSEVLEGSGTIGLLLDLDEGTLSFASRASSLDKVANLGPREFKLRAVFWNLLAVLFPSADSGPGPALEEPRQKIFARLGNSFSDQKSQNIFGKNYQGALSLSGLGM